MNTMATNSPWMTSDEAVVYLRLPSRRALYQRMRRGTIKFYKDGRRILFRREELDALPEPVATPPLGKLIDAGEPSTLENVTPACRGRERR